ncbi:MAG: glycosyltransferase [Lachnospiraceae bacterium]
MKEDRTEESRLRELVSVCFQEYDTEVTDEAGYLHQLAYAVRQNLKHKRAYFAAEKLMPSISTREKQRQNSKNSEKMVSIVVPLYQTPLPFLEEMIASVKEQTYQNWELCLADGSEDAPEIEMYCRSMQREDTRIHYQKLKENLGIAGNTNAAIDMANGTYLALLDHDDLLHPSALYACVKKMKKDKSRMVYTDELTFSGGRITNIETIHRKSDFAPETLKSVNYICHLVVFEKSLLEETGGFQEAYNGSQDHEFLLRLTEAAKKVSHVPQVLYFWRVHEQSVSKDIRAKSYAIDAGKRAVQDAEARNNRSVQVYSTHMCATQYRLEYEMTQYPAVRILLLKEEQTDEKELLDTKQAIETHTAYPSYEVEIAERKKELSWEEQLLAYNEPYIGVFEAGMKPVREDWLQELVQYASLPGVAVTGAKVIDRQEMTWMTTAIKNPANGEWIKENGVSVLSYMELGYMGRNFYAHNVDAIYDKGILLSRKALEEGLVLCEEPSHCIISLERIVYQPYSILVETASADERLAWNPPQNQQKPLIEMEKSEGNMKAKIRYTTGMLKRYGIRELVLKKIEHDHRDSFDYPAWYEQCGKLNEEELQAQESVEFEKKPTISIVVPTYETDERFLKELLESVMAQTYPNWQLCIADGSESDKVKNQIERQYANEMRITYQKLGENKGIAENTNAGLALAKGEFVGFLDHDDCLAPNALFEVVQMYQSHPDAQVFYSDEDKVIDETGAHVQPHLKPDLNWFLLRANNYICHFFVVETALAKEIGGFDAQYDGAQDYDFILRCVERAKETCHIPKILYHWRMHQASTAVNTSSKQYAYDAGKRAIEAHLKRQNMQAEVTLTNDLGFYQTSYKKQGEPTVSYLTPEMARHALLGERVEKQTADYFVICASNVQPQEADWAEILLATAQCSGVGIVGCRVVKEDKKLLHAAVTLDKKYGPVPIYAGLQKGFKGLFSRAVTCQNVSLIGNGCYVVSKEALQKVGGFTTEFQGCYALYDLCLRLQQAGYQVVYQPAVTAKISGKHMEQEEQWEVYASRRSCPPNLKKTEIKKEYADFCEHRSKFLTKWKTEIQKGDAYYNEALSTMPANYMPWGLQKK